MCDKEVRKDFGGKRSDIGGQPGHTAEAERGPDEGRPGHWDPSAAHCLLWDGEATKPEVSCPQQGLRASQRWCKQEGLGVGAPPWGHQGAPQTQAAAGGTGRAWLQQGKGNQDGSQAASSHRRSARLARAPQPGRRLCRMLSPRDPGGGRPGAGGPGHWVLVLLHLVHLSARHSVPHTKVGLPRAGGELCPSDMFC